jgi:hypothetical protein
VARGRFHLVYDLCDHDTPFAVPLLIVGFWLEARPEERLLLGGDGEGDGGSE